MYLPQAYEGIGSGAMVVDPDTGAARTILSDSIIYLISGRAAWTVTRNAADTLPPPPTMGGSNNEVQSRDLSTSRSEEHTSKLQSPDHLVCRLLLEKKKRDKQKDALTSNQRVQTSSSYSRIRR